MDLTIDIVVFQSYFKLIAVHLPACLTAEVVLGGEEHWRKNGTFWVDYKNVKHPAAIEFPKPDIFRYKLEGSDEFKEIGMNNQL